MILNNLVKTIKRKAHRGSQALTTDQITTDIIACANEALRDVYKLIPKRYFWKQGTVAVTAGTQAVPAVYPLASDAQESIVFWYSLSGNVTYLLQKVESDREWFARIWSTATSTNVPQFMRDIGLDTNGYKQIELFPIPNQSLTLHYEYYIKKPTDLTTSDLASEIPVIPDLYHDIIEKGALYYFLKGFDDPAQTVAKADYDASKLAIEIADERDLNGDLSIRWSKVKTELPGFRLY